MEMDKGVKMSLKISIVMPVYNCEKYIDRSIQSVINQTYDNWELIVVNDGSKDSTEIIVRDFEKIDKRIVFINQDNQGVSVARNSGIKLATGELLTFLDADDWFEMDALQKMIEYWDDTLQMILFDYYDVPENGRKQRKKHFNEDEIEFGKNACRSIDDLELTISGFYKEQIGTSTVIEAPWGRVFSTKYIKEMGVEFPIGVFLREDQVFNLKSVINMSSVRYVSIPIYNYYINEASASGALNSNSGERLISNLTLCNQHVNDIFINKNDELYAKAYYNYVYEGIKVVLWWLADEKVKKQKRLGRDYCHKQSKQIKKNICQEYSLSDKIIINLCEKNCFLFVEIIVGMRKKIKKLLNLR